MFSITIFTSSFVKTTGILFLSLALNVYYATYIHYFNIIHNHILI